MAQKSVLILRCGALGDLVYSTSVIDALRLEYGEETIIDYVCTPGSATLFNEDTRINKVFTLKHKKIPILFSKEKKTIINYSKKKPYDVLINFEFGKQFKSLLKNIDAKEKFGAIFNEIIEDKTINRGEMQKKFLKSVVKQSNLDKSFPKVAIKNFKSIQKKYQLDDNYIVLSPSNSHIKRSGINYRAWQNSSWIELINLLSQKNQVVLVGAKGEEDFFENFKPYPNNTIDLVGKNNVTELCTVIKYAKATVCTDSAVGHISAATDTPVFVLMGPNDTTTDSPYKSLTNEINIISLNLECSPCYKTKTMKNCKDNICMKNITAKYVFNSICKSLYP